MLEYRTEGQKGFAIKYSPYFDSVIAHASGANFGLVGNGRVSILGLTVNGIVKEKVYPTNDVMYDITWAESHENQLVGGCGDGSVKLFDITVNDYPVQNWHEHAREVFSVHWDLTAKDKFLSSSWDGTVKVYNPNRETSILTLPVRSCTYSAQFSPHQQGIISCVSSDGNLRIFDLRTPPSASNHLAVTIATNRPPRSSPGVAPPPNLPPAELLSHDWNKYRGTVIATAGVDRVIRTFDLRNAQAGPIAILPGHEYAVRKVAWSPHLPDVLLSASYDMSCRIWTDGTAVGNNPGSTPSVGDPMAFGGGREMGRMDNHSEFIGGIDWCLFGSEGWCASTAWDERVLIWDVRDFIRP